MTNPSGAGAHQLVRPEHGRPDQALLRGGGRPHAVRLRVRRA
jgi:hypothetical protein